MTTSPEESLWVAIHANDAPAVITALQRGAAVTAENEDGLTPLLLSLRLGHEAVARALADAGANTIVITWPGWPALHCAAYGGNPNLIKWLISLGHSPNSRDKNATTPAHHAVSGHAHANQRLGQFASPKRDPNARQHALTITALSQARADLNAGDGDQHTALHLAASLEGVSGDLIRALVAGGADVDARTRTGDTPLHRAAFGGRLDAVRTLLDLGADANSPASGTRIRPLHWAAVRGHLSVVTLLLERGANPAAEDANGQAPVVAAQHSGNKEIMRLLAQKPASAASGPGCLVIVAGMVGATVVLVFAAQSVS